jgi:hypothetical protein
MDDFRTLIYLQTPEEFYNKGNLHAFVAGLVARGHYVSGADWKDVRRVWRAALTQENEQLDSEESERVCIPGVSPLYWQNLETFVEKRSDLLEISLFSTARAGDLLAFEASLYLQPEECTMTLSMQGKWGVLAPFLHWLDILYFTYELWHPLYSYKEGGVEETSYADALAGNITRLYDINLLNHVLVEKLGRELVLSTPAWRITELADGSVFLIPQLIANGGTDEEYSYEREVAAKHLGLSVA